MIDREGNSWPINSCIGLEGIDVEVQFTSLGALVYYISPPVNQEVYTKRAFFIGKLLVNWGSGGLPPEKV